MVTPARDPKKIQECVKAYHENDNNFSKGARALNMSRMTFKRHVQEALGDNAKYDPLVLEAAEAVGAHPSSVNHFWRVKKTEDGRFSVHVTNSAGEQESFRDVILDTLEGINAGLDLPPRFPEAKGNLLVLDPADVHIGKLCVKTETGFEYNESIAEHRLIEGSRQLLEYGVKEGATRVLFVIGNDISHIDNPKGTSTKGTPQDASSSIFTIYRVAQRAYVKVINMALEMGVSVDVVFNPSNHDWVLGFTIAQAIGLLFADHPNVSVTDYYLSERHRKYYRFEKNLFGFTHGDGAKEKDLPELMTLEARPHISDTLFRYWYVHHYHHKIKRAAGISPLQREKDHISMTSICSGPGRMESDECEIEYVRSPSPPDGWHDRNGYVGRQAVEGFIHHPYDGKVGSRTVWF